AGSGGDAGEPPGQTIVIKDFKFEPKTLEVAPGAEVTVKNEDGAAHTVTAGDRSFDTGNIAGSAQKEITVPGAGQVSYRCDIHQYMTGVIQIRGS
nr:cupredoxin domain-containing protein [Actinomycetota bacterium]